MVWQASIESKECTITASAIVLQSGSQRVNQLTMCRLHSLKGARIPSCPNMGTIVP